MQKLIDYKVKSGVREYIRHSCGKKARYHRTSCRWKCQSQQSGTSHVHASQFSRSKPQQPVTTNEENIGRSIGTPYLNKFQKILDKGQNFKGKKRKIMDICFKT